MYSAQAHFTTLTLDWIPCLASFHHWQLRPHTRPLWIEGKMESFWLKIRIVSIMKRHQWKRQGLTANSFVDHCWCIIGCGQPHSLATLTIIDQSTASFCCPWDNNAIVSPVISGTFSISHISTTLETSQTIISYVRFSRDTKISAGICWPANATVSGFSAHANILTLAC